MGGTFDPIHLGHLVAAEEVRAGFGLDRIVFMPSARPPHKPGRVITSAEDRYTMTRLATASNPFFLVSRVEIDREGPSYTIDTVAYFREQYPDQEIFFITGADAILEIFTWREPRRLLSMCKFIAVTRPGFDLAGLSSLKDKIGDEVLDRIHTFPVTALDISSSDLRERIRAGRSARYLVPEPVLEFINETGLYSQS